MNSRYPFTSFPNGWFFVAYSKELRPKEVRPLRYFGKDLVLFRTEDGTPHVLDAHCPHLGAHLGYGGKVKGTTIECPFHGWCLNGNGQCQEIPYASNIPPKAQIRSWPICETNGLIMVYYHAQGELPSWEAPKLHNEYTSNEWSPFYTIHQWKIRSHVQEIFENGTDTPHLVSVHNLKITTSASESSSEIEGVVFIDRTSVKYSPHLILRWILGKQVCISWEFQHQGLGYSVHTVSLKGNMNIHIAILSLATPVDEENCEFHQLFSIKKIPNKVVVPYVTTMLRKYLKRQIDEDIPIWENKVYRNDPLLCNGDGPITKARRWANQFYSDFPRAKITKDDISSMASAVVTKTR
jgi:phenylpropionate dioxygenase-like ring-hydroxylating dioxygenase large terminal subunit